MNIEYAIAAFFQAYAAAFSAFDVDAIADLWEYPAYLTAEDRSATYSDVASFRENTVMLCEFYQSQGVAEATKELIGIQELYPTVVQARTKDRLFDSEGKLVTEWEHVYLLRQTDSGWKAVVAIADGEVAAWRNRGTALGNN